VLLLAFDTATPAVTVALHDGTAVVAEWALADAGRPGELLACAIATVLEQAGAAIGDISVIVAGTGPGPYTGLRAGLVTARALGSVLGTGVHGLCTLDVIAAGAVAVAGTEFLVATDAKRRELYWARYSADGDRLAGPAVASPAALPPGLPVAGDGSLLYPGLLGEPIEPRYPSAATLAHVAVQHLSAGRALLPPVPLYLRRPDARVPGPPKSVLAHLAPAGGGPGRPRAARSGPGRGTAGERLARP
jgi:tRNA threonylcarbamoyl adenosine modification protein YeaZ